MALVTKIISGGQTGSDRGGLEAAHDLGIERGGTAPAKWRAEDGEIPEWYRKGMKLSTSWNYPPRTKDNIADSDGTLIVSLGELTAESGSMLTSRYARSMGRPLLHMTIEKLQNPIGQAMVRGWLEGRGIHVLNVAGPRESREPGIQAATRAALVALLSDGRQA